MSSGISRRDFLSRSAGGLVIGFVLPGCVGRGVLGAAAEALEATTDFGAFLKIASDDTVTIVLPNLEMGQGIWTALPMVLMEELDGDWSKLRVEHGPADATRYGSAFPRFLGNQRTAASATMAYQTLPMRRAGARAREMLLRAAAAELGVSTAELRTRDGAVHWRNQSLRYGHLAEEAGKVTLPPGFVPSLKSPSEFRIIGKPMKRLEAPLKVTGDAKYGMDHQATGMLTAMVLRPPVLGGSFASFLDGADATAMAMPGVYDVAAVPLGVSRAPGFAGATGVAVYAEDFWAAQRARTYLAPRIVWNRGAGAGLDSDAVRAAFISTSAGAGLPVVKRGDPAGALTQAADAYEAVYDLPYAAHAPMEPFCATVTIKDDGANIVGCEIHTGSQSPTTDQQAAAQILGLNPPVPPSFSFLAQRITMTLPFLGSAYGRRSSTGQFHVSEAVFVARTWYQRRRATDLAAARRPVKTVWTRADEFDAAFFRPLAVHRLQAGLGADGMPLAWRHTIVAQQIGPTVPDRFNFEGAADERMPPAPATPRLIPSWAETIPNYEVTAHAPSQLVLPGGARQRLPTVGQWRSIGHSHTQFAIQSFIDELAAAAGIDPVEYRRRLYLTDTRLLRVLEAVAELSGWSLPAAPGAARGVAVQDCVGSVVGTVAEVSVVDGRIRVNRFWCAIDCGLVINPAGVRAQVVSAIVFALSACLYDAIRICDGEVQQRSFADYEVVRMGDMPEIEVEVLPPLDPEVIGGVGEAAVPQVAPAVANAVFALTGKRLRRVPFRIDDEGHAPACLP
jgi:isoquinoline 1-oxidoreductase beta subunit